MRKILIISLASLFSIGCGTAAQENSTVATNANRTANTAVVQPANNSTVVSSHSTDAANSASSANKPVSTSTESPMARPIDVASLTTEIEETEAEYKKNPKLKGDLAKAYFIRATALTGAAQYRAALGDYRKGLKLDPNDAEARQMHDQILTIFKSIGREPPKEGEEPQALPFKKEQ